MEATELTWADQLILQGREEGREEGREQGREEVWRETILRAARLRFGGASPALEQAVQALTREDALLAFFDRTLRAKDEAELLSTPR